MDLTPILDSIVALIICLVSFNLIFTGWRMFSKGNPHLFIPQQIGYFLAKFVLGEEDANRRKDALLTPEKVKRYGLYSILGGCLTLVGGLLMLLDALVK
jgi:hypothetical protein